MIPTSLRPELRTANCAAAKAPVLKSSVKVMRSPSRVMVPIVEWIFTKEPCRACVLGMRVKAWTKRWTDPPLSLRTSMYLSSSHAESGRRESIASSWSAEAVAMARVGRTGLERLVGAWVDQHATDHLHILGEEHDGSSEPCVETDDQKNEHAHRNRGLRGQSSRLLLLDEVRGHRMHLVTRELPVTVLISVTSTHHGGRPTIHLSRPSRNLNLERIRCLRLRAAAASAKLELGEGGGGDGGGGEGGGGEGGGGDGRGGEGGGGDGGG
eukprot:scaffold97362_cov71-Phaeocystis_antarctica.AAC.2